MIKISGDLKMLKNILVIFTVVVSGDFPLNIFIYKINLIRIQCGRSNIVAMKGKSYFPYQEKSHY